MQDQDKPLSHPSQRRYPPELRERATRLVLEAKASGERYGVVSRVARQLGIEPETLRHWAAKAEVDEGLRPGVPTRRRRGSLSSSGRTGSCGERTRYCRQQRLSSGRRSTADKRGSQLHRRPQRPGDRRSPLGGRADLQGTALRPLGLLRLYLPPAEPPLGRRRRAEAAHHRDLGGQLLLLRGREDLAPAPARRGLGRP
jgi:transposase